MLHPNAASGHSDNYAHVACCPLDSFGLAHIKVAVARERQRQRRQIAESYSLSCCQSPQQQQQQLQQQQQQLQLQQRWIIRIPAFSPVAKACAA